MSDEIPKPKTEVDLMTLPLTGEEGFVLSRIDGVTSVTGLGHLTGLPEERVGEILNKLVDVGAIDRGAPRPAASRPRRATTQSPEDMNATVVDGGLSSTEIAELQAEVNALPSDVRGDATVEGDSWDEPTGEEEFKDLPDDDDEGAAQTATKKARDGDDGDEDRHENDAGDDGDNGGDDEGDEESLDKDDEDAAEGEQSTANYRKLYQEKFADLDVDQRVSSARTESGDLLLALCFDGNARVVMAVIENVNSGLEHARLIATHHRSGTGLDALAKKQAFLRDTQVQRALMKNPLMPDSLFKRIMAPKRMNECYRLALSRDITERIKTAARNMFRRKFQEGTAEERTALLFQCEARCLNLLIGATIDSRTASLMCQRQIHSTLFIQNLARFPSTPPPVLLHMYKQPLVRRTNALKLMIQRHPNAPSTLKRGQG